MRAVAHGFTHFLLLVALMAAGCERGKDDKTESAGIKRTMQQGPVSVTLTTDAKQVALAQPFTLTLEAEAEKDVTVELPNLSPTQGDFAVDPMGATDQSDLEGGRKKWTRSYKVESYLGGEHEFPEIKIPYYDRRGADPASTQPAAPDEMVISPFRMIVASDLPADANPEEFVGIRPPVDLPMSWRQVAIGSAAAAVVLAGLLYALWRVLRRIRDQVLAPPPPVPPHVWALDELRALRRGDLLDTGQIQAFYYRLSWIVRCYIERRFGLSAPEMTTEEFMDTLRDTDRLEQHDKTALGPFLEACDLVKFARFEPSRGDGLAALDAAEDFVERTKLVPQAAPTPEPAPTQEAVA